MSHPALRLEHITVFRGETRLLDDLSWTVQPGEHWAVIGPNGAGKSTLLRIASGELFPSEGTVAVLGERFGEADLRDIRARVGWISATLESRLSPCDTALEIVATGATGAWAAWEPCSRQVLEEARALLAEVGMGAVAERPFECLSSGERQRVMLARARLARPALLLLDEPSAGLDLAGREHLLSSLAALASRAHCPPIELISHHVEELFPGVTHALLLKKGRVMAAGPVAKVVTAARLSELFEMPVVVRHDGGRFQAWKAA